MSEVSVLSSIWDAVVFPVKKVGALSRRLGVAAALSLTGTWVITTFDQASPWYWLGAVLTTVASFMIINGAIQVRLDHPLASKIWVFGNREFSQFGTTIFGVLIVLFLLAGIMMLFGAYQMISGAHSANNPASFGSGDFVGIAFVLSLILGVIIAVRLSPLVGYVADQNVFAVEAAWLDTQGQFWKLAFSIFAIVFVYALLWVVGALFGIIGAVLYFDGNVENASNFSQEWARNNLMLLTWPLTLYGQIMICGLLGTIYARTRKEPSATVVESA